MPAMPAASVPQLYLLSLRRHLQDKATSSRSFSNRAFLWRHLHVAYRRPSTCNNAPSLSSRFSTLDRRRASTRARPASNPDRGPASTEDTQTDFSALNVLGATAAPTTSIDECSDTGFLLDSGLRITDGDGVMLLGGEAFVWRPWMASSSASSTAKLTPPPARLLRGTDLAREGNGTGGLVVGQGMLRIPASAWGILALVWPKPDLLIVGTGERIVPLERETREQLQKFGVKIEVLDTRNAASQFNLLATERGTSEVAAAMFPGGFGARRVRRR